MNKPQIESVSIKNKYTDKGPVGQLDASKKVYVVMASAGIYSDGNKRDFLSPYMQMILGFIGLTDVTFVRAEGVKAKPLEKVLESARETIMKL